MKRRQKTIRGRVSLRKSGIRKASLRSISVFLAAEVSFFSPHAGAADIVIDTALSGGGTSLDSAPNGVPVLNLARPDGHGVSHNCFSSYNVGAEGLILNNSTATGLSVLGGALCGNPNYQGRAAVLVINEVAGGRGSRLSGYTEIFGPAADFILANPNGISCNGAGFINTPRVTLSTGAPVFRSGAFQGLDVRGGAVIIEGDGLDAGAAGYFSIISRMALLKGPLWGRDVSIITGTGIFGNDGAFLVEKDSDGKPGFAVDATALGGIYAGRIKILCNERGAGVRSGADWLADASEIEIRSDGTVVLANVQAMEDISVVSSSGDIRQNGVAIALENLYYSAGEIINRGVIDAEKDLVLAGSLDNDFALIASKGNILIEGRGELKNRSGRILLGDTGSGSLVIRGIDSIRGGGGSIVSSGGFDLVMAGDAVLSEETGSLRADGFLRLRAENIVNSSDLEMRGDIILEGRGALILRAGSRRVTDRGRILSAGEDISNSGTISGAGSPPGPGDSSTGVILRRERRPIHNRCRELINYGRLSGAGDMVLRSFP
jgi:filamentous hemagglutinin